MEEGVDLFERILFRFEVGGGEGGEYEWPPVLNASAAECLGKGQNCISEAQFCIK
jgi:hypothetical protein